MPLTRSTIRSSVFRIRTSIPEILPVPTQASLIHLLTTGTCSYRSGSFSKLPKPVVRQYSIRSQPVDWDRDEWRDLISSLLMSRVVCWVPSEQYDYTPAISRETGGAALLLFTNSTCPPIRRTATSGF